MYASSLPLSTKSSEIRRRHQTDPLPHRSEITSRPVSSLASQSGIPVSDESKSYAARAAHDEVPSSIQDGKGSYTSLVVPDKVPSSRHDGKSSYVSRTIQDEIPPSIRDGKGSYASRTARNRLPVSILDERESYAPRTIHDEVPPSIRDGKGSYASRVDPGRLPVTIHRERGSHAARAVHDEIPASIRDGKGTYGSRVGHDQELFTSKHTSESDKPKQPAPRYVGDGLEKTSAAKDIEQPLGQVPWVAERCSHPSKDKVGSGIDKQHVYSRVSSYQADRLTSQGAAQKSLSREDRVPGFVSSSTSDHPFSLASERYKSYLSSRLQESGLMSKTSQAVLPHLTAADRHSKSFPPYETVDKYPPSRQEPQSKTFPESSSREPGSQDSSRMRQSNLSNSNDRHSRFGDDAKEDVARFVEADDQISVSRDHTRPT